MSDMKYFRIICEGGTSSEEQIYCTSEKVNKIKAHLFLLGVAIQVNELNQGDYKMITEFKKLINSNCA